MDEGDGRRVSWLKKSEITKHKFRGVDVSQQTHTHTHIVFLMKLHQEKVTPLLFFSHTPSQVTLSVPAAVQV